MGFSHYTENRILDHIFGGPNYVRPAYLQVGLSITQIQDDGSGITEPSGGYSRVSIDNNTSSWISAETDMDEGRGLKANAASIEFPEATADWGLLVIQKPLSFTSRSPYTVAPPKRLSILLATLLNMSGVTCE